MTPEARRTLEIVAASKSPQWAGSIAPHLWDYWNASWVEFEKMNKDAEDLLWSLHSERLLYVNRDGTPTVRGAVWIGNSFGITGYGRRALEEFRAAA